MSRKFYPLFYVKDKSLVLNVEELVLIPEYRAILVDSNNKTNYGGYAFKVLSFIWFFANYDSPHINLPDQERFNQSVIDSRLKKQEPPFMPSDKEWAAVKKLQELEATRYPQLEVLISLKRGLIATKATIDFLTSEIQDLNNELLVTKKQIAVETSPENKALFRATMDSTKASLAITQDSLQSLAKSVPDSISKIEIMEERVKSSILKKDQLRGGGEIGNRENPE